MTNLENECKLTEALWKQRGELIARLQASEVMRDHYKTMADSWKELATERAKRADKYLETLEMITMLIKDSVN